jgi:pimeloyl-ACP methyl ester carboxylesterase
LSPLHQTVTQLWQRAFENFIRLAALLGFCVSVFFMRVLLFLAALLCGLPSFAASRCDVNVPTQMAELGDVHLAYQSIGRASDPALLLVMGLGGQLIHWPDEVVVALCEQGFRVIRYDNRDVGLSTWVQAPPSPNLTYEVLRYKIGLPVSAPYSLTDMAQDALGLMDALHVQRFHVLGASMGGMIAQHLADMAPQRIETLTLIMTSSGAPGLPMPSPALLQLLARRGAPDRQTALEQQADLLAALGSPEIKDDRQALLRPGVQSRRGEAADSGHSGRTQPRCTVESPARAHAGGARHGRSVVAGHARDSRGGAHPGQPAETDSGPGPSVPGGLQSAVAGRGVAVFAGAS